MKRRVGQWGNACLQKQVPLHAGCKLLSSCELLLEPPGPAAAPYHSRGSRVCAATGRGLRAAGPKSATEEREKLTGSRQARGSSVSHWHHIRCGAPVRW